MKHSMIAILALLTMASAWAQGTWFDRINVSADFRIRHEVIDEEGEDTRARERIRARVNLNGQVTENVKLGIGLASGSDDPVSTNQTLDEGFSSKQINLDLAYFDWKANASNLHVIGGKMKNPFYTPQGTELIWDGDLNPEGLTLAYNRPMGSGNLFSTVGAFAVEERGSDDDTLLYGAQVGVNTPVSDAVNVIAGGSYYDYANLEGFSPVFDPDDPFGNDIDIHGDYQFPFKELEGFIEVQSNVRDLPVSVFADYVKNTEAEVDDTGWLAGFTVGKAKAPGSWQLAYNYREVEANAVLGVFTDSDFAGGGTDGKGHEIGFTYQVDKNISAGATYFINEQNLENPQEYNRLQLDVQFKLK